MSESESTHHTSFYPLMIVLVAFVLVNAVDIYGLLKRRNAVRMQLQQYEEILPQAQADQQKLIEVSRELMLLAPYSETAREIVRIYNIRPLQVPAGEGL